jgi:hypothetical protein
MGPLVEYSISSYAMVTLRIEGQRSGFRVQELVLRINPGLDQHKL